MQLICKLGFGDNDSNSCEDDGYACSRIRLGSSIGVNTVVCPIILADCLDIYT